MRSIISKYFGQTGLQNNSSSTNSSVEYNSPLEGTGDDDILIGREGNDIIVGNNGEDELIGGQGNDLMNGGFQSDYLFGGEGEDTYVLHTHGGTDIFNLGEATDSTDTVRIDIRNHTSSMSAKVIDFDEADRIVLNTIGDVEIESTFVLDDNVGNALMYVSHNDSLTVVKFEGVDASFVEDRII